MLNKQAIRRFNFYQVKDYNPEFAQKMAEQNFIKSDKEYRFAIVGSGPAGFYLSKMLLGSVKNCRVDIFDRNPHPYGLIRTGVAPDHQAMKKIMKDFRQVFEQNQGRSAFFGNVWVGDVNQSLEDYDISQKHDGETISVDQLRQKYSAVILAHGALKDKSLGLENEHETKGIVSARRVVNWYNGSLDNDLDIENEFYLNRAKNVTVIGNGNIFCDMARTLLKDPKEFEATDMPESAIEILRASSMVNLQSVARRGITHAAFTTKEVREIAAIKGIELYMMKDEVQRSMTEASEQEMRSNYARAVGRRTEFLLKSFRAIQNEEHYEEIINNGKKKLILRFLLSPDKIQVENNSLKGLQFTPQKLEGTQNEQRAFKDDSLSNVSIDSDIIIKSIGNKTMPISGVPFDFKKNVVPQNFGCVVDPEDENKPQIGLYVAGWAKRGPVGIIDATLRDAKETFGMIKHHLEGDQLPEMKTTMEEVQDILKGKSVSYNKWLDVDEIEIQRGTKTRESKIREKILDRDEMLNLVNQN